MLVAAAVVVGVVVAAVATAAMVATTRPKTFDVAVGRRVLV